MMYPIDLHGARIEYGSRDDERAQFEREFGRARRNFAILFWAALFTWAACGFALLAAFGGVL